MTKEIQLLHNEIVLVDDDMFDYLNQWKWHSSHGYAVRNYQINHKQSTISMPHLILGISQEIEIDHANNIKLDNRRCNLRPCTHSQNAANRRIQSNNKSGFRGVFWAKERGKWLAYIQHLGKFMHLGYFDNPLDAKRVRDKKAIEIFGEFARTE